ncbi:MAG TPA: TonB-dependent receptor [Candidatus Baltobacteraceae bacterium]|nr:TonB-dependent receptor [Candidatus Baltobacteraceae bacterium]
MLIRSLFAFLVLFCYPLYASAAATLVVTVTNGDRQPISGAQVVVATDPAQRDVTDARGTVRVRVPQTGAFALRVSASGYRSFSEILRGTDQKSITVTLEPSAGSLHVIGSVTGHARTPFNATPVAQKVYPREAYRDQGQPDVSSVMNQTPGALALTNTGTNTDTPLAPSFPSVRNGLPFETPVLIDGEPIVTPSGTLDLSLLPTYVLQEVEIVKGAGDIADAGGGVGGAINFRTADPTLGQRGTFETEGDSHGGSFTDLAYDGTEPGGALAYASMFSVDGSPCCGSDPSNYTRKAILVKLRSTPSAGLSISGTVLTVSLDRSLDSIYGLPGFGYEHLGFGDLAASLDRGNDAFSVHAFVAQTQQGLVSPALIATPADNESGVTLAWEHAGGKLAFDTSGRVLDASLVGTNETETQSNARESVTYKPDARNEFDLSGELNADRTYRGTLDAPAARAGYSYELSSGLALRASYGTSAVLPPLEAVNTIDVIERATGGDLGLEWRLRGGSTTLSADLYRNATQGVYAFDFGNYTNGPPMIESGAEFTLQQFKRVGMGFIAALSLPRTYAWGDTGTTAYDDQNIGYGEIAPFRIPYAQGYAEISYKWPHGSRASLGALYVGSNNAYGAPAFETLNSNLELSLGSRAKLQFSAQNLTDALANRVPVFAPMPQYGLVPFTLRFMFRQSFGTGSLYEH